MLVAARTVPKRIYMHPCMVFPSIAGIQIGCPSYQEAVKALLECDANKDRMISRDEFEEVAIRLLRFAAVRGARSFLKLYTTGMLVRKCSHTIT